MHPTTAIEARRCEDDVVKITDHRVIKETVRSEEMMADSRTKKTVNPNETLRAPRTGMKAREEVISSTVAEDIDKDQS